MRQSRTSGSVGVVGEQSPAATRPACPPSLPGMREVEVPLLDVHTFEGWTVTGRYQAWNKAQGKAHRLVALFTRRSADH